MATGCTAIFKSSEKSPIGLIQIGELVKEAGFPPGVINIITGDGKVGAALASHMDINKISFTGSVFAGKKVQELAAKRYAAQYLKSKLQLLIFTQQPKARHSRTRRQIPVYHLLRCKHRKRAPTP
jgi:delta 1-pyrroline-5-carboxylate dehydrogenase